MKKTDAMKRSCLKPELLPIYDVLRLIGRSRGFVYEHMKKGDFPKPVRFSARCVMWRAKDIQSWIDNLSHEA